MDNHDPIDPPALDDLIRAELLGAGGGSDRRLIGVEYERLLLEASTRRTAPLTAVYELLARATSITGGEAVFEGAIQKGLRTADFELSVEPGGQVEVSTPPARAVASLDAAVVAADAVLLRALESTGFELVALGHAPMTPVGEIGLLPRTRYRIMDARMPQRGALSRNMMRATAGFQVTLDFADGRDGERLLALMFRLSPVIAAWSANSRVVAGADSGYASYRHHVWLHTDADRSALFARCLEFDGALDGYVDWVRKARVLFLTRNGDLMEAPERPFERLVADGMVTRADLALHLTSMFPFVRMRGHVEVRCADSVEWPRARAFAALLGAIAYVPAVRSAAEQLSDALVPSSHEDLLEFHERVARHGLATTVTDGRSLCHFAVELAELAAAALAANPRAIDSPDALGPLRLLESNCA
jgi:glutamate--cysteine ligase